MESQKFEREPDQSVAHINDTVPAPLPASLTDQSQSPLLRLPSEIRNCIYSYVFDDFRGECKYPYEHPNPICMYRRGENTYVDERPAKYAVALLATCKQISFEAGVLAFSQITFSDIVGCLETFLRTYGARYFSSVIVRLYVRREDAGDPALEWITEGPVDPEVYKPHKLPALRHLTMTYHCYYPERCQVDPLADIVGMTWLDNHARKYAEILAGERAYGDDFVLSVDKRIIGPTGGRLYRSQHQSIIEMQPRE